MMSMIGMLGILRIIGKTIGMVTIIGMLGILRIIGKAIGMITIIGMFGKLVGIDHNRDNTRDDDHIVCMYGHHI